MIDISVNKFRSVDLTPKNKSVGEKITLVLDALAKKLAVRWLYESHGLLSGGAGSSLYFMNRYFNTGNSTCLDQSLQILEREIASINDSEAEDYFSIGYHASSSCWLIDEFIKFDVLDETEKISSREWVQLARESTTEEEFTSNRHDLFYGYIGKAVIIMEHDKELAKPFISNIINTLRRNAIWDAKRAHWETPYPFHATTPFEKTINLGIPHGTCGIILFLLKCCDVYNLHDELHDTLKGSISWMVDQLNRNSNKLLYSYSSTPSDTGKLGWCYGDQALAFTLLRYYETFNCNTAKVKAYELIEQAASKPIEKTGVQYYPQYGYYDVRICHGTSSVAYMWQKMYHITKDESIKVLADKWLNITLDNLDIFLPQLDKIAELEKDNQTIDTSMGFLNGLSGVGLVLIAFDNPTLSSWDKLLLLDRPGRE